MVLCRTHVVNNYELTTQNKMASKEDKPKSKDKDESTESKQDIKSQIPAAVFVVSALGIILALMISQWAWLYSCPCRKM